MAVPTAQAQTAGGAAPNADSLPAFNSIRTPASPAFVLLGIEPSSVERPNTPSDLAATIINRTDNLKSLPKDFAVEFSPYWLLPHRRLEWRNDARRSILESFERTATVSVATAEVGSSSAPVTGLALGGRAALASGHLSQASMSALANLEDRLRATAQILNEVILPRRRPADSTWVSEIKAANNDPGLIQAANERHEKAIAELLAVAEQDARYVDARNSIDADYQDFAVQREGFLLEVAGGLVWQAPGAIRDSLELTRWAAWATASYEMPSVSFVGVFRYLDGRGAVGDNAIDNGVRIILTRERFAISAEYVDRHFLGSSSKPTQWRLAGVFDYRISPTLWLNGTFGRDYDKSAPGSLLAQLGLSVNFSQKRTAAPQE